MMRKIQLGLAALGAFALFALALWAGGDAKLVVARDSGGIDAGRLMSQIATPFAGTRSDNATAVAQAKARGNGKNKSARTDGNPKSTPRSQAPGSRFGDGVPRGSYRSAPPRDHDVTRGSHADSGA